MPRKPEILKRHTVARSRLFRADELLLRFANGEERVYEKLCAGGPGAVLMVPVLDDGRVVMIREYAAGIHDYHLGLPKGAVDRGEDILAAADRELKEEIGYGARDLRFLKRMNLSPAYMEHGINVILARGLYPERLEGDEPEPIEVVPVAFEELLTLAEADEVCEGRTIAALFYAHAWLEREAAYNRTG